MQRKMSTLLSVCVALAVTGCSTPIQHDAKNGTITYPVTKGTEVLDTARNFAMDMNWQLKGEKGRTIGDVQETVTLTAVDDNGKTVTFTASYQKGKVPKLTVMSPAGAQFSTAQITTEIARRLGVASDAKRLNKNT